MVLKGIDLDNLRVPDSKTRHWGRAPLRSRTFFTGLARYGRRWQNFLFSDPFIYENYLDQEWIPRRPLGAGGFGGVGLWERKRGIDGKVIDRMAIKQRYGLEQNENEYTGTWRQDLAIEAVIQSQLCSMDDSDNIIQLRKYKFYPPTETSIMGTARFYMEYAKWNTLDTLVQRHRAWDLYLPELFLWHTFLGLARSIDLMRRCPEKWQPTTSPPINQDHKDDPDPSTFIVHMDLKSANVALGKRKRFDINVPEESPEEDSDDDFETVVSMEDEDAAEESEVLSDTEDDNSDEPESNDQDRLQEMARQALNFTFQPQRRVMGENQDNYPLRHGLSSNTGESSEPEDPPKEAKYSPDRGTGTDEDEDGSQSRSRSSDNSNSSNQETVEGEDVVTDIALDVSRDSVSNGSESHHDKIGDPEDYESSDDEDSHSDNLPKYPTIKVMDFGIARRTGPFDSKNPDEVRQQGTPGYESPEQLRLGRHDNPPLHRYTDSDFQIDEKQNVWGVGLIMHDLMTLSRPGFIRSALDNMGVGQDEYYRRLVGPQAQQQPRKHFTNSLKTKRKPEYTLRLRELIRRCIRPCRSYRPSSSRLVKLVEAGLRQYLYDHKHEGRRRRRRGTDPKDRVCLTVDDFNKLKTLGDANIPVDSTDNDDIEEFRLLNDKARADIGEAFLRPPKKKWKQFMNDYPPEDDNGLADAEGQHWDVIGDVVLFDKHVKNKKKKKKKKKRVLSWESRTHADPAYRQKLSLMRTALGSITSSKPIALFEYVLDQEKGDEQEAIDKLRWLYGRQKPGWRWLQDASLLRRAEAVNARCSRRTLKECLYFVATTHRGVEQVDQAVDNLKTVFG